MSTDTAAERCARCGGELIAGSLALPMLGPAQFAYNLLGKSIETNVDALMCAQCGAVTFTAHDLKHIIQAHAAKQRAGRR